jgi:hypothetical protein
MIKCRHCEQTFKFYAQRTRHENKQHGGLSNKNEQTFDDFQPETIEHTFDSSSSPDTITNEQPKESNNGYTNVFSNFPSFKPREVTNDSDDKPPIDDAGIKQAFSPDLLADILRNLSRMISDMDGAGDAGVFTPMESKQIAILIYDPVIQSINKYFGGDVNKFKMGIAVLIIMLGKGRVHFSAIQAKKKAKKTANEPIGFIPEERDTNEPETPNPSEFSLANLAKMQRDNGSSDNE